MVSRTLYGFLFGLLIIAFAACSSSSGNLQMGMTPNQTIAALGQPDLRDTVPDPAGGNAQVLRYIWLKPAQAAVFDSSNHLVRIEAVPAAQQQVAEQQQSQQQRQSSFDPINTPLNYLFYPFKAGVMWIGAGINCVATGACHKPEVPSPGSSAG